MEYRTLVGSNIYSMNPALREEFHYDAFMGFGTVLSINANYEEALVAFEFAQFLRPKRPESYGKMAQIYKETGQEELYNLYQDYEADFLK